MSDFKVITPEERESFGEVFKQFSTRNDQASIEGESAAAEKQVAVNEQTVDSIATGDTVLEGTYEPETEEIAI
jgi:hypothetical protein